METSNDVIDLLVVGGGTAGIVGAKTASRLGARVVLVERARTGGDCLWTGCVPSKTLLSAAAAAVGPRAGVNPALAPDGATGRMDFSAVRARIAAAITTIEPDDSPASLKAVGVTVRHGAARFTGPGRAEIDGEEIRFHQALVATGSDPVLPPIPGLDRAHVVTSETVWDLEELPQHLVIIGGGPIACELGQAFARLGARVVMLVRSRILPKEDPDAAAIIRSSLTQDGVHIIEDIAVEDVTSAASQDSSDATAGTAGRDGRGEAVNLVRTGDGRSFPADTILVAAGRRARTKGLGLELVGVDLDEKGHVLVDAAMRTSSPTIWAAGDVTPNPDFTHLAGVYASTAASNAVLGVRRAVSRTVPRVTYTSPEVAAVGITSPEGANQRVSTIEHADADRAITENQVAGFTRLVMDRRGRILGGTIVGPRAGETLGELTLAVHQKLSTRDLAGVTHPYPTYNDGLWNAAIADARTALEIPLVRAAMSALVYFTRWRLTHKSTHHSGEASDTKQLE
ncbi:FAD-dependent oxidoreductase [Arthrobacter cheniae]|uniref:FAD-dependent oxidoreductase n=1 Tax=Arthrobacter cheniae TaxID=1258888 RepID=A0A3A5M3P8_9MICC|nr:FAD-dependent oxidoreductase [Arthrobacter cheniae]RJT81076.1 FAD-dependent oxidoreductase [Arthrobacter cheniae]